MKKVTGLTVFALAFSTSIAFADVPGVISVQGNLVVDGNIAVKSQSEALVSTTQLSVSNNGVSLQNSTNLAEFGRGGVLQNAAGNIGVNLGAGTANSQINNMGLALGTSDGVFGTAELLNKQNTDVKGGYTAYFSPNQSILTDNALFNARGNIGLNIVAGVANAQANSTAISNSASYGKVSQVRANNEQTTYVIGTVNQNSSNNTAAISNGALQQAAGNIGLNIASGVGNTQGNSLSLANSH